MPHIAYFSLGGTIASVKGPGQSGASPALNAEDLLTHLSLNSENLTVEAIDFRQVASPEVAIADILQLHRAIEDAVAKGAHGVVVSQGTDTMEEAAFLLDLLWRGEEPVVFTGAMRNPSLLSADGPANLQAALRVASSKLVRGSGVLVVINDEIHAARFVRKTHTSNPAAFHSSPLGPVGWIAEGRSMIAFRPSSRPCLHASGMSDVPRVALIKLGMGDDADMLKAVPQLGYEGVVIEGSGGGHVKSAALPLIVQTLEAMPVVLASRAGNGEVLRYTYDFPGSEMDLLGRGVIAAGYLDGLKARLALSLCLARGFDRAAIAKTFAAYSSAVAE